MSARAEISSTVVAWMPRSSKSSKAALTMASRVRAVCRSLSPVAAMAPWWQNCHLAAMPTGSTAEKGVLSLQVVEGEDPIDAVGQTEGGEGQHADAHVQPVEPGGDAGEEQHGREEHGRQHVGVGVVGGL